MVVSLGRIISTDLLKIGRSAPSISGTNIIIVPYPLSARAPNAQLAVDRK